MSNEVSGQPLEVQQFSDFIDNSPDWVVRMSMEVCDSFNSGTKLEDGFGHVGNTGSISVHHYSWYSLTDSSARTLHPFIRIPIKLKAYLLLIQ